MGDGHMAATKEHSKSQKSSKQQPKQHPEPPSITPLAAETRLGATVDFNVPMLHTFLC